jgi:peroxiredoxin
VLSAFRYFLVFILVACSARESLSQKITVQGVAPGAERKTIRISAPGDLLTYLEKPLAKATIDSTGNFTLSFQSDHTVLAILSIDFHKAEMLVEPSKHYSLRIAPMNYDDITEINPFLQSQNLSLEILRPEPPELNASVDRLNTLYSDFLMDKFKELYNDRNTILLDTFKNRLNREFSGVTNPYFKTNLTYKIASLELLTQSQTQWQVARKYFIDKPIFYFNVEYMDFFDNFFTKYITVTSNILRKVDYQSLLKNPDPCKTILKAMTADSLLKNEQLRELVMLKGMMELYNTPTYNQDQVLSVIKSASVTSKYPENRLVADNLYQLLTRLKPGTPAPGFTLKNRDHQMQSLQLFRGKPVVINFWTTYCEECLNEMDLLKPIYDRYKDRITFISISADKSFAKMQFFINLKKGYTWHFLCTEDQTEILKDYDVRSYPLFLIIDKEGNIGRYPAKLPGNGLESELQKFIGE